MLADRIRLPSAVQSRPYLACLDEVGLQEASAVSVPADCPLQWIPETRSISCTFDQAADLCFELQFQFGEQGLRTILIEIQILPDPRMLWNSLESPRDAPFPVNDTDFYAAANRNGQVIAASLRGRSHAHTGGFREDAFCCFVPENENVVVFAISDGAGSAKYSRLGANLACRAVREYVELNNVPELSVEKLVQDAFMDACRQIRNAAKTHELAIRELACTLSVVVIQKRGDEYIIWAAGVGDCPVVFIDNAGRPSLVFQPEDGLFAGETKFLVDDSCQAPRLVVHSLRIPEDRFGAVFAMTDGVSDPWFECLNGLVDERKWMEFLQSLPTANDSGRLDENAEAWMEWLQFWSVGNHDDRTLMIFKP